MMTSSRWIDRLLSAGVALLLSVAGYSCGGMEEESGGSREIAAKGGSSGTQAATKTTDSKSSGTKTDGQGTGDGDGDGDGQGGPPAAEAPTCACPSGFSVCTCPAGPAAEEGSQGGPQDGMQGANAQAANAGGPQAEGAVCCCCAVAAPAQAPAPTPAQ